MKKKYVIQKVRYEFDNLMSHGLSAMIAFLALMSTLSLKVCKLKS